MKKMVMFMKRLCVICCMGMLSLFFMTNSYSFDAPHTATAVPSVSCSRCHSLHNAPGGSLTTYNGNVNLCQSCHVVANPLAGTLPMTDSEMATTTGTGRNHRWDRSIQAGVAPLSLVAGSSGNAFGLRTAAEISNGDLRLMLQKFNNVVVCSVCHDQHNHSRAAWDPFSSAVYTAGVTTDRHLMRMANDTNQMCEDCHYYRAMNYNRASGGDGSYPANGVNVFSHPVGDALNSQGYDRPAPRDYNGVAQQTAPRYYTNGTDTNSTNNVVLDSGSRARCMSCHRMHYVDSNGETVDAP